jgi:hypothetical protein
MIPKGFLVKNRLRKVLGKRGFLRAHFGLFFPKNLSLFYKGLVKNENRVKVY